MNILEAEDMIKGLPDDALYQQAQSPNGQVPQYLVVSEIQRRTDMRKKYAAAAQPSNGSVKDQILQQGIASMAPPMAQPMPQPMPQAMPPQGAPAQPMPQPMAPQGMATGGIVRLQAGGLTGMPGESALSPLMEQAKILARTTGRNIEDIYNELKYQSDLSAPNYSLLAPATGPAQNRPEFMQSAIDTAQGIGMTDVPDLSGINQLPRDLNTQSMNISSDSTQSQLSPLRPMGSISQGIYDSLSGDQISSRLPSSPTAQELYGNFGSGVDARTVTTRRRGDTAPGTGMPDFPSLVVGEPRTRRSVQEGLGPESVSPSYGYLSPAFEDMYSSMLDPQNSTNPDLSSALEAAVNSTTDASSKQEAPGITGLPTATPPPTTDIATTPPATDKAIQGGSPIQKQALSFDDLIAQSKSESMSNALIQLGAGIAGGNLSQGISASGLALTKGNNNARDLAMAQRIQESKAAETASDRAFRSSESKLDREAKQAQFDDELKLLQSKVEATIDVSDATSRREALRTYAAELEALAKNPVGLTEADRLRMSRLRTLIDSYAASVGMQLPAIETQPTPLLNESGWNVRR